MNVRKEAFEHWTPRDSADLYGVRDWGAGYFDVNSQGELTVTAFGKDGPAVSLMEIVKGIKERGMDMPVLLRLRNILDTQIRLLHSSIAKAIKQTGFQVPRRLSDQSKSAAAGCGRNRPFRTGIPSWF